MKWEEASLQLKLGQDHQLVDVTHQCVITHRILASTRRGMVIQEHPLRTIHLKCTSHIRSQLQKVWSKIQARNRHLEKERRNLTQLFNRVRHLWKQVLSQAAPLEYSRRILMKLKHQLWTKTKLVPKRLHQLDKLSQSYRMPLRQVKRELHQTMLEIKLMILETKNMMKTSKKREDCSKYEPNLTTLHDYSFLSDTIRFFQQYPDFIIK